MEAREYTLDGLIQAIADWLAQAALPPMTSEQQPDQPLEDSPDTAIAETSDSSTDIPTDSSTDPSTEINSDSTEEPVSMTESTDADTEAPIHSDVQSDDQDSADLDTPMLASSMAESTVSPLSLDSMDAIAVDSVETPVAAASISAQSDLESDATMQPSIDDGESDVIAIAPVLESLESLTQDAISTDSESNWDDNADESTPSTVNFDFPLDHPMTTDGNTLDTQAAATETDPADPVPFLDETEPLSKIPVMEDTSSPPVARDLTPEPRVTPANPNGRSRNQDSDRPVIEVELVADSEDIYPMETVYVELDSSREEESDWAP